MTQKHAIITGASSGLGEALAKHLALQGYHLTLSARRVDRLEAVRDAIAKTHPKIEILLAPADVTDKEATKAVIETSVNHFKRLDVYIANAGLGMWSRFRDLADPDELLDSHAHQLYGSGLRHLLFTRLLARKPRLICSGLISARSDSSCLSYRLCCIKVCGERFY